MLQRLNHVLFTHKKNLWEGRVAGTSTRTYSIDEVTLRIHIRKCSAQELSLVIFVTFRNNSEKTLESCIFEKKGLSVYFYNMFFMMPLKQSNWFYNFDENRDKPLSTPYGNSLFFFHSS